MLVSPDAAAPDLAGVIAETNSLYSLVTCETFDFSRRVVLCCKSVRSVIPNEL